MGGTQIPAVASPSCCPVTTDCWWGQTSVSERVDRWTDPGQTVHLLPSTSASLSAKQRTRQGHILTGSRNGHRGRLLLGSSPASPGSRAGPGQLHLPGPAVGRQLPSGLPPLPPQPPIPGCAPRGVPGPMAHGPMAMAVAEGVARTSSDAATDSAASRLTSRVGRPSPTFSVFRDAVGSGRWGWDAALG